MSEVTPIYLIIVTWAALLCGVGSVLLSLYNYSTLSIHWFTESMKVMYDLVCAMHSIDQHSIVLSLTALYRFNTYFMCKQNVTFTVSANTRIETLLPVFHRPTERLCRSWWSGCMLCSRAALYRSRRATVCESLWTTASNSSTNAVSALHTSKVYRILY